MNPALEGWFQNAGKWHPELEKLRSIIVSCGLTEHIKWGGPCYQSGKRNLITIGGFKNNCAISFFDGAWLEDPAGILVKPGENTRAARVVRFTQLAQIEALEETLKSLIEQAIAFDRAGTSVDLAAFGEPEGPQEFDHILKNSPALAAAFDALTPGRQRAYRLHFSGAKQSKTRIVRIEKATDRILKGIGPNDCSCGLSKRLPYCDGSHHQLE